MNIKETILEAWGNIKYYLAKGMSVETSNFEALLNSLPDDEVLHRCREIDCPYCYSEEEKRETAKRLIDEYVAKMKRRGFGMRERPTLKHFLSLLDREV